MLWRVAVIGWLRTLPDSPPRVIGSVSSGSEQEAGSLAVHGAEHFLGRHSLVDVRTVLIGQGSFRWLPIHFKISSHRQREMTHYRLRQGDMQDLFQAINTAIHPESQTALKVQTWWYIYMTFLQERVMLFPTYMVLYLVKFNWIDLAFTNIRKPYYIMT